MYGLCDFTQMCIEYTFVLGYDNKENSLSSLMVSTLSSQSSGCGFNPNIRRMFFFLLLFFFFFFVIHTFIHSLFKKKNLVGK